MAKSTKPGGSYECNPYSLKHNGQKLGSQGTPTPNKFSLSKSGKKPA
jgi:hypothetical protein